MREQEGQSSGLYPHPSVEEIVAFRLKQCPQHLQSGFIKASCSKTFNYSSEGVEIFRKK